MPSLRPSLPIRVAALVLVVTGAACPGADADDDGASAGTTEATSTGTNPPTSATGGGETSAAGSDDASPGSTAATDSTGGGPADESGTGTGVDEGLVPMHVLSTHGARFIRSCDLGQTWSEVWEQDPAPDCFHDADSLYPRTVYAQGVFVAASGWGEPGAIYTSADALTWDRLPSSDVPDLGDASLAGGVFFDGQRFVIFRRVISDDGLTWSVGEDNLEPPGVGNVRRVAFDEDAGVLVVAGNDATVYVSEDWGLTWTDPTTASAACPDSIQHRGEIVVDHGTIVVGGATSCVSTDAGLTWTTVDPGGNVADLLSVPDGFVAILNNEQVAHSTDGMTWESVGQIPVAADTTAAIWTGVDDILVAVATLPNDGGGVMLRSEDGGATWTMGETALPGPTCPRINLETFWVPAEVCAQ